MSETNNKDEKIILEAKKRFKKCAEWEAAARQNFEADIRFANADPDNGYQWPDELRRLRETDNKPCLTINKTRQHCLQIINDAKQHKVSINIKATGSGASYDAAQVFEGVIRHIEYESNAGVAYDTATQFQVQGGIGYWRVVTEYADNDTFDQELRIRRIKDPLTVYMDPDCNELDCSDARFAFIFSDMPRDEFEAEYPDIDVTSNGAVLGESVWIGEDKVRVAEYFRVVSKSDKLVAMIDPATGAATSVHKGDIPGEVHALVKDDPNTRHRDIIKKHVEWFKIAGGQIVDRRDGKTPMLDETIPIVPIVGEQTIIDGKLDRKGHTRAMKDAQRIYNYWTSSAVENVALQSKAPYIASKESTEGLEGYWETANTENHSYLPYNARDDQNRELPPPQRAQPPQMATAYVQGMQIAQNEMMMASGQYQAQMGENENAKSGVAIAERQRQGDNATYHFIDGLAIGIRRTGRILIDLIPKVYDTKRIIRILSEDGSEKEVQLDPNAQAAYQEQQKDQEGNVTAIFNPTVGKYSVEADVGPGFATRRQEAFNAFSQSISSNPSLFPVIGDLMYRVADFPLADEIAERLHRMVPAQALGTAPPPELAQAQQHIQGLQQLLTKMTTDLAERETQLKAKDAQKDIDAFEADTKRLAAVANMPPEVPLSAIEPLLRKIISESMGSTLGPIETATQQGALMQETQPTQMNPDQGQQQSPQQ